MRKNISTKDKRIKAKIESVYNDRPSGAVTASELLQRARCCYRFFVQGDWSNASYLYVLQCKECTAATRVRAHRQLAECFRKQPISWQPYTGIFVYEYTTLR